MVAAAIGSPASAAGVSAHAVGQVISNVTYCLDGNSAQRLDLLYPTINVTFPRPVIIWMHGGTWVSGGKEDAYSDPYVQGLRNAGFIVASLNYLLAPARKFPAQTRDLTCGIRYLRSTAARYGIDPDLFGAMGGSAGGHLAQMLGVNDGGRLFDGGGYPGYRSDVQAVASLWGVSDLTRHDLGPADMQKLPSIFGKSSRWAAASPMTYVRADLPPFLLVHGNRDSDVPVSQSKRMYHALQAAGVPSTLVVVKNAEHRLNPAGGSISPSQSAVVSRVVTFFRWALRHKPAAPVVPSADPPAPTGSVAIGQTAGATGCGTFGAATRLWPAWPAPEAIGCPG
jgi:acetyl esterase/lipase